MNYLEKLLKIYDKRISPVWRGGSLIRDGSEVEDCHYVLTDVASPISISRQECIIIKECMTLFRPKKCFVLGNAFGFSASYIALVVDGYAGELVVTLDSYEEGDGKYAKLISEFCTSELQLNYAKLIHHVGRSPEDVPMACRGNLFDLVLIDGCHGYPQTVADFTAIEPYLSSRSVVFWHDYYILAVRDSVKVAISHGFKCALLLTSCGLAYGTLSQELYDIFYDNFKLLTVPFQQRLNDSSG